ncbi:MAG: TonB-dependent receptor [Gammaproteobacteria bacterium]|nr:TonB-dependent receptor [Gammaproteobacteria bacterium]
MTRSKRRKLMREQARAPRTLVRTGIPVASALLAAIPAAYAQEQAPAETGGLQEVVVTAEKRVENLQDVPISVQVLDTKTLDQLNVGNIDDYVKFAPAINYVRGEGQGGNSNPGESHIYIRGVVSGGTNHTGSQPSVGEYLDEQPVTTIDGNVDVHIYDIQRIEVLEGPQGTLYGASSESGTVRIITNKPDPSKFAAGFDVQGNQILQHGAGYEAEGFVNIPITSTMAVRLVGWDEHDGGYISNVAGTDVNACIVNGVRSFPTWAAANGNPGVCPAQAPIGAGAISNAAYVKNDYNTVNTKGGRGALRWDLGDWTVTPTFMAQDVTTEGFFGYDPAVGDLQLVHFSPENSSDSWYQGALTVEGKISNFDLTYSGGFFKRDTHTLADYADYSLFYDRVYGSGVYWTGNNGLPIMPQELVVSRHDFEKWSHEARLSTPIDLPLKATVGVFVQRQQHNIFEQYTMPGYNFVSPYGSPLNLNGYADAASIPTLYQTIWLTDETRVDRDQAAFAQGTWDITKQLSLTGGIRAYKYDNTVDGFFGYSAVHGGSGMAHCFGPPDVKFAPCNDLAQRSDGHGTVPLGTLTFKATPDVMFYATYSKGFRPGGINRTAQAGVPPYSADFLKNYEIGWKTQLFDHHLRMNGAIFREDWDDFQFSFLGLNSVTIIENAASARITGLENNIEWAPTPGFLGSLNFQWINPYVTSKVCSGGLPCPDVFGVPSATGSYLWAPVGTHLPITPDFKGSIIARFNLTPIGKLEPYFQGNWTYQSSASVQLRVDQGGIVGAMPPYALVDLRLGATYDRVTGELYLTNAFDRLAQLSRFTQTAPTKYDGSPTPVDTQPYIVPAQPRTIGIKVGMRF